MPTVDIFIKTCVHDAEYHKYCLQSIEKFCTGFRKVRVIEGEHPQGYLYQQVVKMCADQYTDADYVLITDSDTLFTKPVTPETFMVDGKPIWMQTPAEELRGIPGPEAWFSVMRNFFGQEPEYEFMRRQGFMIPTKLLKELRNYCLEKHRTPLDAYVMNSKAFSEFNVMGMFFWLFHRDGFHWINTAKDPMPELTVRQFWSMDRVEKNLPEIQRILGG